MGGSIVTVEGVGSEALEDYSFGPFRLYLSRRLLLENAQPVVLGSRAFDLLVALVSRRGEIIAKSELLDLVWRGVFVAEGTLRVHMAGLRAALNDGRDGRRYIVTTPGRGYSFVAPVSFNAGPAASIPAAPAPRLNEPPALLTEVFGREQAVASLVAQLPQRRFITIVGLGGVGKTTVALAAAQALRSAYLHGALFVDLAPIADPALVPSALASWLGLPVNSSEPIPALVGALRQRNMLLILDNCEHVADVAAELAEAIGRGAPQVNILATSREPLRARGEHLHRLSPLETPSERDALGAAAALSSPAVQLFMARAEAAVSTFVMTDGNAPAIAEICRRLDGIPLAIELAAGRVETLGLRGLVKGLDDRFRVLEGGHRTALPQHQTLAATFDWSCQFLSPQAQTVFRRLAIFATEFSMASAVAVAVGEGVAESEALQALASLVSTSLVSTITRQESATYRLLESTRAYARARLVASGELDTIARRHAARCLERLARVDPYRQAQPSSAFAEVYRHQIDDLRVALDWAFSSAGDQRLGIALTVATAPLWAHLSLHEECRSRTVAALNALGDAPSDDEDAMKLFATMGTVLAYTRSSEARGAWTETLKIAERLGDADYQLRALRGLWTSSFSEGLLPTAVSLTDDYANISRRSGGTDDHFHWIRMRGMTRFYRGEFEASQGDLEEALQGYLKSSDLDLVRFQFDQRSVVCVSLSKILWVRGFPDRALAVADQAFEHAVAAGHELSMIYALAYASCRMALLTGDLPRAENAVGALFQRALHYPLPLWDIMGDCWQGVVAARRGDLEAAIAHLGRALQTIPEGSFSLHYGQFMGEYAHALARTGEVERARSSMDRAIEISGRQNEQWFLPELLRLRGEILRLETTSGSEDAAEAGFEASMALARRQGALSYELRTALSLANLRADQGRRVEGREILNEVLARFDEGFSTGDLQAAKRFIDAAG